MAKNLYLGNGNWATTKGSTLFYTVEDGIYEGVPSEVIRNSEATTINKDGVLETVDVDTSAIDYTNNANGALRLEGETTNLEPNADLGFFQSPPSSVTTTTSPSGDETGQIPVPSATSTRYEKSISAGTYSNGQKMVYSWYRKRISTPTDDSFIGDLDVRTLTNMTSISQKQIESDINGYDRFQSVVEIIDGSILSKWRGYFGNVVGVGNSSVAYWGHQLEEGEVASSLVRTSGATDTRAADSLINVGREELFNSVEGVIEIDCRVFANDGTAKKISLSDGSNNSNEVTLHFRSSDNTLRAHSYAGGVEQTPIQTVVADATQINSFKIKYGTTLALKINDIEIGSVAATPPTGLKIFQFSGATGGSAFHRGEVTKLIIHKDTTSY